MMGGLPMTWKWYCAALLCIPPAWAQTGVWKTGTPMPTPRSEMRAAVIDSLIYIPGGFDGGPNNAFEAYNPATQAWKSLKKMPQGLDHHMVAEYQGKLYVLKGKTWQYDPATDNWTDTRKPGKHFRADGTAVTLGGYIYVIGGGVLPIERYSPERDEWAELSPMKVNRGHVQAVVLDGKIWVLAGRNANPLKSVEIYDPAGDSWSDGPEMLDVHSGFGAAVVGGKILAVGGEIYTTSARIVKTAEMYDPGMGKWSLLPPMAEERWVHGTASVAFAGKLYLIGGSTRAYAVVNTGNVSIFEPGSSTPVFHPRAREGKGRRTGLPGPGWSAGQGLWIFAGSGRDAYRDGLGRLLP
jgi:hypothetical protein